MQGIIILAVFRHFCEHKTAKIAKTVGTDQYSLIEQSGDNANWQVVLTFSALNYFEMHIVREID